MATERATYCRICVAGCGIVVSTEGDTVVGVRGNHAHVLSQGYTCPKGRAIPALHHHPRAATSFMNKSRGSTGRAMV